MKPVILLVDDNEDILEYLGRFLQNEYEIITAKNGKEAMDILLQRGVDLVVSDVMMPVMDGFELCKLIKLNTEVCHTPVLLLTAKSTIQSKIQGLELGADAYIEKPFSLEHLQVQISSLITNRNKVKSYFANSPLAHIYSIAYTVSDERFLERIEDTIIEHMQDAQLDVEHLARFMNMSRPTLYRKLKDITDLTPNEMINLVRLKKAARLLIEGSSNISEVSQAVGYTNSNHFGRNFQKQFGKLPSEFLKEKQVHNIDPGRNKVE